MGMNIFNNKVVARFAFRQMRQAIFKLLQAEDALIFACRQERHDLKAQTGRSMIEMLGVLAIIGVLSVGGIAGYSKAMERYRVNETINQISHIVQNTRDLFKTQPNLYGAMSSSEVVMSDSTYANRRLADKAKLFSTSLVKNDYKNLFGGDIHFFADGRFLNKDGKAFILVFTGISQEACIELVTRDWQSGLGLVAMKPWGSSNPYRIKNCYIGNCTTQYTTGSAIVCGKDMPVSVEQAVTACDKEKNNNIAWKFY
ncbi:MAG: hypothetical protein II830_00745 [Alphaproteobacteria bacterium]|nr:hypothetical protein [Alphaproteobacteria bacterium]